MAIFLAATGPALALFAQHNEWRVERKQVSLTPINADALLSSEAADSSGQTESDATSASYYDANSKRIGNRRWRR